jgi:alpha-tubulin suppressor-like RCC1 family protein
MKFSRFALRIPNRFVSFIAIFPLVLAAFPAHAATPRAHTQSSTLMTPGGANLNGMALPNGDSSVAWFEWGPRGHFTEITELMNVGNGNSVVRISAGISNLVLNTAYQCRLVVSNAAGMHHGGIDVFTTGDRVVAWGTTVPPGLSNAVGLAAGGGFSLALRADGTVLAWGQNESGEGDVPAGLNNAVAVAAGIQHRLALRADGTVLAWGGSYYGQTNVPPALSNAVEIACGLYHSIGLRADGTVIAWGYNGYNETGQATVPAGLSNVVGVACGGEHNLAVMADGSVRAWGYNSRGQATVPSGLSNVIAVAGGSYHSIALRADGTVVAWGELYYGATTVPPGLSNVINIAARGYSSLALRADGSLVAWGEGGDVPPGLTNIVRLVAGTYHVLAIGDARPQIQNQFAYGPANHDLVIALKGTDLNSDTLNFRVITLPAAGQLYQFDGGARGAAISSAGGVVGDLEGRLIFAPDNDAFGSPYATFQFVANDGRLDSDAATVTLHIHGARAFTQAASHIGPNQATLNGMAMANTFSSTAWFEWGERGGYTEVTPPDTVGNGTGVVRLSAAITNLTEGGVYQYRLVVSNAFGLKRGAVQWFTTGSRIAQLGYSASDMDLGNVVAVAVGSNHRLALKNDGTVAAWGAGGPGQTGSGHYGQASVPSGLSNVIAIAGGYYHSLALLSDGTVTAWGGIGSYGSMAAPPGLNDVIGIAAGSHYNLALRSDGTVIAWGYNGIGQTNVPAGLSNVVAIAAGYSHSLALLADGTIVAWGANSDLWSRLPAGLNEVVALSSDLALRTDGTVVPLGIPAGQTNLPSDLSEVVSVAGASLALRTDGTVVGWERQSTWDELLGWDAIKYVVLPAGLSNMIAIAGNTGYGLALGDARPQALPQTVFGGANQDLVIHLSGFDANAQALTFRVGSLPAVGALYQCNNGIRGPAIASPDMLVSDPAGQVVYVPLPDQFGSPYDSFSFYTHGGLLDSVPAPVTIHIQQARALTQFATNIRQTRATLNGMALPNSFASMAWFEWGARGNFTDTTAPVSVGNGYGVVRVSEELSNLTAGGTYQYRIVESNSKGLTRGATRLFTTGARVTAWGDNSSGQTNVPLDLSNVVAVAGGGRHSLALKSDGTVTAWGYNYYGQINVPLGLSNVVSVAGGGVHSLALLSNGTVVAWGAGGPLLTGSPHYGQSIVPGGLGNVIAVAAGAYHSLALRSDGSVIAWGYNGQGQTNVPAGLENVVAIAARSVHSVALKADGTVTTWGIREKPPLGLHDVVSISGGDSHDLALKSDGDIVQWGMHYSEAQYPGGIAPIPSALTNGLEVASGYWHSLAMQKDGTIFAWGVNYYVPAGLRGVVAIAAGGFHNLALGGNWQPEANPQTLAAQADQDLLIELSGFDADGDPLSFRISQLPAAGTLFQYAAGGRGTPVTNPNTSVSDAQGRVVFAPEPGSFGSPYDSFCFLANDGLGDSAPGVVTIHGPPPAPQLSVALSGWNSDGIFELNFSGGNGAVYRVWGSTNLTDWELLGTAAETSPGWYQFADPFAANWPWRFYRAGSP